LEKQLKNIDDIVRFPNSVLTNDAKNPLLNYPKFIFHSKNQETCHVLKRVPSINQKGLKEEEGQHPSLFHY